MKNLFITILLAIAMAIPATFKCAAQEHVADAYNKFSVSIDEDYTTMCKNINYNDPKSGNVIGECIVKQFKLPANKGFLIEKLTNAMSRYSENAYHSASGKAGSEGVTYAIAYGTGKNDFELVGADNDLNFMIVCFKDKQRSDFRTSYAIEWKQDKDDYYKGKIYKIYGKKPEDYQSSSTLMLNKNNKSGFTLKVDSLIDLKSLNNLSDISQLETLKEQLGNTYNFKLYSLSNNEKSTNDNSTWLTTFAMYCNKFKEKVKQSPNKGAVYATELLQMCKHADGVITAGEKKLCAKTLKECQKCSNDTFVMGLLEEAIGWLNGKNKD